MTCDQPTGAVGASRQPHGSEVVSASPRMVRAEGLEPPQLSSLEPKSSASTSSATPADSIMSGRDAAGGGLITWAHHSAAKKWPSPNLPGLPAAAGLIQRKMVGIYLMADRISP